MAPQMKPSPTVSLLLTNLRLLDYDHHSPDSFPITPDVFTSLSNKGKAFEHVVYHIFRSYAPEECELRFRGCWPVYEPQQARDLRTAVFKWLEDLKREGLLPGVLLRRSTLDDCAGQRYEELLLAVSTMVVKHNAELGKYGRIKHTMAYRQATSAAPNPQLLTIFSVAHRHALGRLFETRQRAKAGWVSVSKILDAKEAEAAAMIAQLGDEEEVEEEMSRKDRVYIENVRGRWANSWMGDPKWLQLMIDGDPEMTRDRFLELPFDEALARHREFKDGQDQQMISSRVSLKELDRKVLVQQRRVEEMRKLRERTGFTGAIQGSVSPRKRDSLIKAAPKRGLKVEFKSHQNLHFRNLSPSRKKPGRHESEYSELLNNLTEELIDAGAPRQRPERDAVAHPRYAPYQEEDGSGDSRQSRRVSFDQDALYSKPDAEDTVSDAYKLDFNEKSVPVFPSEPEENGAFDSHSSVSARPPVKISQQLKSEALASGSSGQSFTESGSGSDDEQFSYSAAISPRLGSSPPPQRAPKDPTPKREPRKSLRQSDGSGAYDLKPPSEDPAPEKRPRKSLRQSLGFGDDDLLAEQIVSRITGAASLSPEKPSLEKRKPPKQFAYNHSLSPIASPSPPLEPSFSIDETFGDSMELPQSTIDTSSLSSPKPPLERVTTPQEELLMSDDYNSVFKSRPKVALSPPFSPARNGKGFVGGSSPRIPGLESSDEEYEGEDQGVSSPLARKRRW